MPEQGPTEREVDAFRQAADAGQWGPGCGCDHIGYTCDVCYRRGLAAAESFTRARHVCEAVEGLSDERAVGIARFIEAHRPRPQGLAECAALMRAALLDALGGTDTTTPNPQNRP